MNELLSSFRIFCCKFQNDLTFSCLHLLRAVDIKSAQQTNQKSWIYRHCNLQHRHLQRQSWFKSNVHHLLAQENRNQHLLPRCLTNCSLQFINRKLIIHLPVHCLFAFTTISVCIYMVSENYNIYMFTCWVRQCKWQLMLLWFNPMSYVTQIHCLHSVIQDHEAFDEFWL